MQNITKKIEPTEEVCIKFTNDEMERLNMRPGQKFSIHSNDDGSLLLKPYVSLELDISDWPRESLESLIIASCEKDISINELFNYVLDTYINKQDGIEEINS
jgi:hypothetical protein